MSPNNLFSEIESQLSNNRCYIEDARLLLAVCDVTSANKLSRFNKRYGPRSIDIVYNGQDALNKILDADPQYDIVICDWDIPEIPGVDICGHIKSQQALKNIYFVLLSAVDSELRKSSAQSAMADGFFLKPENLDKMEQQLGQI